MFSFQHATALSLLMASNVTKLYNNKLSYFQTKSRTSGVKKDPRKLIVVVGAKILIMFLASYMKIASFFGPSPILSLFFHMFYFYFIILHF